MTEDTTSPDQIRDAFASLCSGKSHITRRDLDSARLPAPIVTFLENAMSAGRGIPNGTAHEAMDYASWVRSLYP
jgi:hypothetical protein